MGAREQFKNIKVDFIWINRVYNLLVNIVATKNKEILLAHAPSCGGGGFEVEFSITEQ